MHLERPPSWSAILTLTVTIFIAVLAHLDVLPWWYLPLLFTCAGWRLAVAASRLRPPGKLVRAILVVSVGVMIVSQFGNLLGQRGATSLLAGMLALKLLETQRYRDVFLAAILLYFLAISAFLDEQGLIMLPYLLAVATGSLCSLMLLRDQRHQESRWGPLFFSLRLIALSLIPAVILLFGFPRLASPLWGVPQQETARTGLSDEMSPGAFSELITDDSPALRARFSQGQRPNNAQLYWRGPVLWDYDGETWRNDIPRGWPQTTPNANAIVTAATPLQYEITLIPTDRRYRVLLEMPVDVPPGIRLTRDLVAYGEEAVDEPITYRASSTLAYQFNSGDLSERERQRALHLPEGFNPRTIAMVESWRNELQQPEPLIQRALNRFQQNGFFYTLTPPPLGRHAMDEFLFDTRAGFCEHYASAFVVLMRAAGIPARVVTGYQGGEDAGDYVLVRHSNAHAWAEVWLPRRGWVRIDPTAAVSPQRVENGLLSSSAAPEGWRYSPWARAVQRQWDQIQDRWSRWVVEFDSDDQGDLLERLGLQHFGPGALFFFAFIPLLVVMTAISWWLLWRRQQARDPLYQAYHLLMKKLERAGLDAQKHETPANLRERLPSDTVESKDVLRLLQDFEQLRYMPNPSAKAIQHWTQRVRRIKLKRRWNHSGEHR
jgi:transglutaminase-like putative cysteine protease